MTVIAVVPIVVSAAFGWRWLEIPWVPIAMLGTASAFTVGFRNNATYARTWEARQIWGGIVQREPGVGVDGARPRRHRPRGGRTAAGAGADDDVTRVLVHRHVAWLTALRYQLREPRSWENMDRADNQAFSAATTRCRSATARCRPSWRGCSARRIGVRARTANRATAILALQSGHLRARSPRRARSTPTGTSHSRGRSPSWRRCRDAVSASRTSRIRAQFATLNYWFIRLFVCFVPFGMLQEFRRLGGAGVWLAIPLSIIVTWLFLALEKVGESTENPFEGGSNDVPITALSRTIEIDLRQMLDEADVPPPLTPVRDILM
jgi:putative membrane protein